MHHSSNYVKSYLDRRAIALLLLGFSAGVPILLIFSTLSLWLTEAGVSRDMVTTFSWAALGYSFKFVWSPLIDMLPLPMLSRKLGQRRGWLLFAQTLIIVAIVCMAMVNPADSGSLNTMAFAAVLLGFSAATQDVVIDAYRIEIAPNNPSMQTVMSSTYTAGYRLGMIAAGAGSLILAAWLGSSKEHYVYEAWRNTYWAMAAIMGVGVATTLSVREPENHRENTSALSATDNLHLLLMFVLCVVAFVAAFCFSGSVLPEKSSSPVVSLFWETVRLSVSLAAAAVVGFGVVRSGLVAKKLAWQTWVAPLADFFHRYGKRAILLLALIGLYRISDIVAGVISNVFYADLGFTKTEIATAVKTFGVIMSIGGGFAGGILAQRFRIMNMMMIGAIVAAATNLLFALLATRGHDVALMYFAVGVDNFASGLASTVFVVFLSTLTNIRFTAVQYALLSSLMSLSPKILGGYSGAIVNNIGYTQFFLFTAALGLPILVLVWLADKYLFRE
ncbi:MFS transporter [Kingella negevensis]|uniref:AmpG family muropeptide MFS transporter n=1 Tax=Kingella negevensis TaxID=1522312 RepID=UPI00254A3704|nr:MFS transporter [Kingella negevensis]MDK4685240.1 MFS transporter [Kingella negevensis]MDK4708571.1 MFS transporter [Kingella negevensis]MDK4710342.1 MFS transporter [Kingella negevensis]